MPCSQVLRYCCLIAGLLGGTVRAAEPPSVPAASSLDFNRDIRPVFAAHCHRCHGPERAESGLRLHRREDAFRGGDSGAVLVAGNAADSTLWRLVAGEDADRAMPPDGERLSPEELTLLRRWINEGAVWPEETDPSVPAAASDHWSFRPPLRHAPPAVQATSWPRGAIDRFVLARLEAEGIAPSGEAHRATLLRRLSLDLVGLPPGLEEVDEFEQDTAPDAYERVVDRLLASPHFGERWGRHWLDLARYADTNGYDNDEPRPDAWRYRDWVIEALNRDLPFDRFTIEQLAGDLLPGAGFDERLATGFHRNTPTNTEGGVDREEFRVRTVADRVNTTGTVWLGLTVGCAQCHSHKYDPLTQREYFGMFAVFDNADEAEAACDDGARAQVLAAAPAARTTHVHLRGDFLTPGEAVTPHAPAVLPPLVCENPAPATGNADSRLALARWLVAEENPLTARVTVNRLWQHVFGRGLVATPDDFGTQGAQPTHPELLDWLALELVDRGWRQKEIIRLIVCSAAYRQDSAARADLAERDPENLLLARQNRFRPEAEIARDLPLAASQLLNPQIGGPSFASGAADATERRRRGMYLLSPRALPDPLLTTFDVPDSHVACTRRERSNTPLQALALLNDAAFYEAAQALGRRIVSERAGGVAERGEHAFRLCLARRPEADELARIERLYAEQLELCRLDPAGVQAIVGAALPPAGVAPEELAAWTGVARALLNLDEFFTRE